ncbi:MAG: lipoprotein signal peptidase [Pseudomonadota bacterium]|jgi:signal peptidase II
MLKRWLALAGLVIVLDQCSKLYIASHFVYGESLPVLNVFSLVLWHNEGAAYGFLNDFGGLQRWLFSGIAVGASGWMIWLLRKHANQTLFPLALSLILGGALGNLIDRIAYGYVVDFLLFHWDAHTFPAFNVADSAITCGAALLIWESFTEKKHATTVS